MRDMENCLPYSRKAFDFEWTVPEFGFEWSSPDRKEVAKRTGRVLIPKPADRARYYLPLQDEPGLFKTFAELEPDEEGVLAFANKYGLLGIAAPLPVSISGVVELSAETMSSWLDQVEAMRRLLRLLDCIQSSNKRELAKRVTWDADGVSVHWTSVLGGAKYESHHILATNEIHPERLARFSRGDLIQPALLYLQIEINKEMKKHPAPARLLRERDGKLSVYCVPSSLISAMWLQFALAIDGNKDYRLCEGCHRYFEVGTGTSAGGRRVDAKACSATCRQRLQRKEKKNVRL